jgi:YggT family protein
MINLNPFINLIFSILSIYTFCLILYVIFFYLLMFKVINPHNQFVQAVNRFLIRIIEPVLAKIRKFVPIVAGVDISIIVLFLAIYLIRDILYTYVYVH